MTVAHVDAPTILAHSTCRVGNGCPRRNRSGHRGGTDVARVLREAARPTDVIARYGGEQFVTLLPETDLGGAWRFGEAIRSAVERYDQPLAANRGDCPISVSVGVAELRPRQTRSSLLRHGDRALRTAKRQGRNRVCGYGHAQAPSHYVDSA